MNINVIIIHTLKKFPKNATIKFTDIVLLSTILVCFSPGNQYRLQHCPNQGADSSPCLIHGNRLTTGLGLYTEPVGKVEYTNEL